MCCVHAAVKSCPHHLPRFGTNILTTSCRSPNHGISISADFCIVVQTSVHGSVNSGNTSLAVGKSVQSKMQFKKAHQTPCCFLLQNSQLSIFVAATTAFSHLTLPQLPAPQKTSGITLNHVCATANKLLVSC